MKILSDIRPLSNCHFESRTEKPATKLRKRRPRADDVVCGILGPGQICVLGGYYHVGKTPVASDLAFHVANKLSWLGRATQKRPVAIIDFETPPLTYRQNMEALKRRYAPARSQRPRAHLLLAKSTSPGITPLRLPKGWQAREQFIRKLLTESPAALVIFDPAEYFFHFNRRKPSHIHVLFLQLRQILIDFPRAAMILVMNIGKRGRRRRSLLREPQQWLEDIAGDLDLVNRADVRLGVDFHEDPALRVIHGTRRGESMEPIIVKQLGIEGDWRGFEEVVLDPPTRQIAFTDHQEMYWDRLPREFRFVAVVRAGLVPRSSLSRLIHAAQSMGLLTQQNGTYYKS